MVAPSCAPHNGTVPGKSEANGIFCLELEYMIEFRGGVPLRLVCVLVFLSTDDPDNMYGTGSIMLPPPVIDMPVRSPMEYCLDSSIVCRVCLTLVLVSLVRYNGVNSSL